MRRRLRKQLQRTITGKTQKEVRQKLAKITSEIDEGTYIEPNSIKLSEWLKTWLRDYIGNVKPATVKSYTDHVNLNIIPYLGKTQLSKLSPAMIQSNRAHGILNGSASGGLTLDLVRSDLNVDIDAIVVTSGLGGVYPKGLPIGRVTIVERNPGALYLEISVEAYARVQSLEEVLVITSLTDEQRASADDISEADAQEMSAVNNVPEVQTLAQSPDEDEG